MNPCRRAPTRAKGFEKAVYAKLDDAQKAKHFPEMFGEKPSPAQNMQTAQSMAVPQYRSKVGGLQGSKWKEWSDSVDKLSKLSPAERRAYMETFEAYRRLAGNPRTNRTLLEALGDARRDMVKDRKDAARWSPRIDYFRFQKSP